MQLKLMRPAEVVNVCVNSRPHTTDAPSLSVFTRVKVIGLKASLLRIFV